MNVLGKLFFKKWQLMFLLLLGFGHNTIGQDVLFSQFYKNPIYINPALTALQECGRAYFNYRNTSIGPLDQRFYALAFDIPFIESNSGLGAMFQWQEDGLKRTGTFGFQFSRKVSITENLFLTMGMEAGGIFRTWNQSDIRLPSDIDNSSGGGTGVTPPSTLIYDLAAGAGVNYKQHYAGFAVRHITESQARAININSPVYRKYIAHYAARIPYRLPGARTGFFSPHVIFEQQNGNNHLTSGVYAIYNKVGAGLWIRNHFPFKTSFLVLMATIKRQNFEFSYSYDFPLNGSGIVTGGHEIALIYYLSTFKKKHEGLNSKNCLSF